MHDRGGWSAHARAAINFNKLDDASSPYDASLSVIQVRPRTYHFSRVPLKHVPLCILAIYVNYILRISLSPCARLLLQLFPIFYKTANCKILT